MTQYSDKRTSFNPIYSFVRALQLEGTPFSEQEKGVSPYSTNRVGKMFGNVREDIWPYDATIWPPNEPAGIDKHASQYRIHHYFRLRSELEIKNALANNLTVSISVPYFSQWCDTENGVIQFPSQNEASIGMHSVLIVGYRDDHQYFNFRNSWGAEWGDDGYGWLPYGYFDQLGIEANRIIYIPNESLLDYSKQKHRGISIAEWGFHNPVRNLMHGVSISDHGKNEEVAWSFVFEESEELYVEEFFVNPIYRQRGFARELWNSLNTLSIRIGKPLKFWLPHIDSVMLGQDIHDIAWKFNLRIHESTVNWAAKILLPKTT